MGRLSGLLVFVVLSFQSLHADVGLGPVPIKHQGRTPYCGLYSMSSFIELWANSVPRSEPIPSLEPGFLAVAYNALIGSGRRGTLLNELLSATRQYGIIPRRSWHQENLPFPERGVMDGWRWAHRSVIDLDVSYRILDALYKVGSDRRSTGLAYLEETIGMDLSSAQVEQYSPDLYNRIVHRLYSRTPVLVGVDLGAISGNFGSYEAVGVSDVHGDSEHEDEHRLHAMVALAHCNRPDSPRGVCQRFAQEMRDLKIPECLVLQNSWGPEVHNRGLVCLSKKATEEVLTAALLF